MDTELDIDDVELNDFFEVTKEEPSELDTPDKTVDLEKQDEEKNEDTASIKDDETDEKSSATASERGVLAALKEERRLRQEAQSEVESLRNQIPKKSDPSEPDPLDDAEAWKEWNRDQVRAELKADNDNAFKDKVEKSRLVAIESYGEDYEKAEEAFAILANQDSDLGVQLFESANPAEFAYKIGKEFIKSQDAKVEARIRAEIAAEGGNTDTKSKLPNLALVAGKGNNSVDVEIDNDDFNEIFGDQKY